MKAKVFDLYLKNPTDGPDFEARVIAKNHDDAVNHFLKEINYGNFDPWLKNDLSQYVTEATE